MYPQVQTSDNTPMYIGLAVLALLIVGGILLYVFVFKCKEDGSECTTTSDCCEGLECVDSKCSSSTPTVSPQPVVVNNVEPEPEPEPDPELETCADWDVDNDCATGTTLTPGTVIGNSQSECCVSVLADPAEAAAGSNDCEGTWSACTANCEVAGDRTFTETVGQSGQGAPCPVATACQPGEGGCPLNTDCEGTWSACNANCERTFTETIPQSGSGAACQGAQVCNPGDGDCSPTMDTDGWYWSEDSAGLSCDTVCANNGKSCQDGDWELHSVDNFRDVFGTSMSNSFCTDFTPSGGGIAPYVKTDGMCRYRNMGDQGGAPAGVTLCGPSSPTYRRLCKCVE